MGNPSASVARYNILKSIHSNEHSKSSEGLKMPFAVVASKGHPHTSSIHFTSQSESIKGALGP